MTNHEPKHPPADMAGLDGLIEVTQADRDAAASGYFAWCSNNRVIPDRMKSGNADNHSMVQAFARHRATQLQAFADRIKALEAENEWLREALKAEAQAIKAKNLEVELDRLLARREEQ